MKSLLLSILTSGSLVFLAGAGSSALPWATTKRVKNYVRGEVLVKLAPHSRLTGQTARAAFGARFGVRDSADLGESGLIKMKIDPALSVEDTVAELNRDPEVESAQPNFIYHMSSVPNDTSYGQLWGLKNTGQTIATGSYATHNPGTAGKDIGAESAWSVTTNCSSAPVAVIDSGVNYDQEDLAANMWDGGVSYPHHGYDFVDSDFTPLDLNGHGTHVAGTIGAVGNNGTGVTGVCWTAKIMALRVLDATGSGTTSNIVLAINMAVAQGAKVINMSLGGGSYDAAFNTAVLNASNAGVVVVVAAGNDGLNNDNSGNATYPCNFTAANLLCVAALDQSYSLASFSNYGSTSVDVGAPGTNIRSSWNGLQTDTTDDFTSGWTKNDATWGYQSVTLSSSTYDMMTNPSNWDGSSTSYANNADARAYKTFNLHGYDAVTLSYYAFINTQSSTDYFNTAYYTGAIDPFGSGTILDSLSGNGGTSALEMSYDLGGCLVTTCSIGFQLTSNATTVSRGVGILLFTLTKTVLNTNTYNTIDGTSMATPIVAGIAALVYSYNPNYTAAQVVAAIKNGGVSASALSGKSTTGKSVSAIGALSYIATPSGLTAAIQ